MIYTIGNRKVVFEGKNHFIAHNAAVIGSVHIMENVGIWFNSVVRADNARITIGEGSNIQDSCVLHTDEGIDLVVGKMVTVGHNAVLHGCTIGDNTLIGINAVVLNGSRIGASCIIGAGALVPENTIIPDASLVLGVPGKIIRMVTEPEIQENHRGAVHYIGKITHYNKSLHEDCRGDL